MAGRTPPRAARRAECPPPPITVDKAARARLKGQRPCVVWLTGRPAAGKSTIADLLDRSLHSLGRHTYVLDGDNIRGGLNRDLGFTDADRAENIRRTAEASKLLVDAGIIVIAALISPFERERQMARELFDAGEFIEVFVDTPLSEAEARDPKGQYERARRGEIERFTGIDSPYEPPTDAELHIQTTRTAPEDAVEYVLAELQARHILEPD
jgi:bifunctional enzyme CysN/CysC